eukprot:2350800-Pyramimonas_sp.AAC.1
MPTSTVVRAPRRLRRHGGGERLIMMYDSILTVWSAPSVSKLYVMISAEAAGFAESATRRLELLYHMSIGEFLLHAGMPNPAGSGNLE